MELVFGIGFMVAGAVLLTYAEPLADTPTLLGAYGLGVLRLAGSIFLAAGLLDLVVAVLIYSLRRRALPAAVLLCLISASLTMYLMTRGVLMGVMNAILNLLLPAYLLHPAVRYEFD
jgi:hypothetical protein